MRAKHHYTIYKVVYHYIGDYLDEGYTTRKMVMYQTNKRAKAEQFYYNHLWEEHGTVYKGDYYPHVDIIFVRDY